MHGESNIKLIINFYDAICNLFTYSRKSKRKKEMGRETGAPRIIATYCRKLIYIPPKFWMKHFLCSFVRTSRLRSLAFETLRNSERGPPPHPHFYDTADVKMVDRFS
jgi:hypothetical protein